MTDYDTELETAAGGTEADAIAALAATPIITEFTPGDRRTIVTPPGWDITHVEHNGPTPGRSVGTVIVRDAAGFVAAVRQRTVGSVALYADDASKTLTAVLNDDHADVPGWRDHTVDLRLRTRPEWDHWVRADGKYVTQVEFAQHIEDGLHEIITPAAADMLDLAQTFAATTTAKFKGGQRLATGERQFTYDEEINAKAGSAGTVAIPDTFTLRIAPFYGSDAVDITARFRFRLRNGDLTLGYRLDRPDDAALAAYQSVVTRASDDLGITPIAGTAPGAR